ncbi:MAG: hypothetical protein A4E71_01034 [Smithella sp. PtaU1.Bin162]|nr:MAG: hypothetical protein A4E71_01034 [Smithella sp. PtaU1.Bin162]
MAWVNPPTAMKLRMVPIAILVAFSKDKYSYDHSENLKVNMDATDTAIGRANIVPRKKLRIIMREYCIKSIFLTGAAGIKRIFSCIISQMSAESAKISSVPNASEAMLSFQPIDSRIAAISYLSSGCIRRSRISLISLLRALSFSL